MAGASWEATSEWWWLEVPDGWEDPQRVLCPNCYQIWRLVIAGRNREKGEALVAELGERTKYLAIDIEDESSLRSVLDDADLVIHAAGPFQRREKCSVLEAAIHSKVSYVDVCDDLQYAQRAKQLHAKAVASNVSAIVSAGIYPGVSNIMAAELVRSAITGSADGSVSKPDRLRFSYFTAGSGGVGPTILATSFLLLGEEVLAYSQGEQVKRRPYSSELLVDFGKGIGKRNVYLLNLPEVTSAFEVLGVPTVSARFGTAPEFWNWAMAAVARFASKDFLADRNKVATLVKLSDPWVRAVDGIVGERVSMRVDLECIDGKKAVGIYSHKKLSIL
ncbi:hypothetical protein O6H91_Y021600 [Diphasiastrum complanatum]|nr:hypothetical protein O6H91_Y021600 [Diphasiastrum complanatum]